MISELAEAMWEIGAIYYYFTEKHQVKRPKGDTGGDCVSSLLDASKYLRKIKGTSSIVREIGSWRVKLNQKYSVGDLLDEEDAKELGNASWEWAAQLSTLAAELDKEQRTLELIEERMKKVENGFAPILGNIKDYITRMQEATLTFVESSPTERSLEPTLRGLLNRADSGELVLTGYFDQYLLKDFKTKTPKPAVRFISPELTSSKQDKINLDALQRLSKMGAEVRFHPMLHARMMLSPTEIIVGSADIKSDCLGGRRYDAGIWSNNPILVRRGMAFFEKIWNESSPL